MTGHLLVVLCNPSEGSGLRTLNRVGVAQQLLGHAEVSIGNIFAAATHRTGDITAVGTEATHWATARRDLSARLQGATDVLLAYGVKEPNGAARQHHRDQVRWLRTLIQEQGPSVWQVGDGPRHPSRWQRWTAVHHPGVPFRLALERSLSFITL